MSAHSASLSRRYGWWAAGLVITVVMLALIAAALFAGTFRRFVPVTLTSERSGLVMEPGAKVKLRGAEVGRVGSLRSTGDAASLTLEIAPDQIRYIPANVEAEIKATTAFGAKYVDLIVPGEPTAQRLERGAVLQSRNVSTEVNTVFENLVGILDKIDISKLNGTLTALAEGLRGQGERIGQATTDANRVLSAINPRMDTLREDFRSTAKFADAYSAAAQDIITVLDAASTSSETVSRQASDLDALLLNTIGFANAGIDLLAPNRDNAIRAINVLEPTTNLLFNYDPMLTCTLMGAKWYLDNGAHEAVGGNGRTLVVDAGLHFGDDPYKYPQHLPIVAARGGPGGKPSCGSLPDASKMFPVRQLITNTGWGTGLDIRPNPGIGHPFLENLFPVTKAIPEPPRVWLDGPPAIGPVPYPGAPPYGAPLYGPGGTPLYPGVPPAPPQ
ncbi:MCE family protein, partial [Mycolicibacterium vanbaalenii]|uniref:MCE family protein n=1 Tax=Mycolicibacterium vanbaalenii TaxID=110539 RepID=UPI001330DE7D